LYPDHPMSNTTLPEYLSTSDCLRQIVRSYGFALLFCVAILPTRGQTNDLVKLEHLQQLLQHEQGIQVVNFWATWCAPCLQELPLFEKIRQERKDVHVRLISMDMDLDPNPDKVRKFVARKKISSEVLILDEKNPNQWIEKIDKSWSGALPATLVLNNKSGKRKFVEKQLHSGDLEKLIAEVQ
jgi:thiol-disulfide isomerase/thioredoxin